MRDSEFQKAIDGWSEAELDSAPDLRPTPEMVRLVQAREEPRRALDCGRVHLARRIREGRRLGGDTPG